MATESVRIEKVLQNFTQPIFIGSVQNRKDQTLSRLEGYILVSLIFHLSIGAAHNNEHATG